MLEIVLPIECQKDWENLELTKGLIFNFLLLLNITGIFLCAYVFSENIPVIKFLKKHALIIIRIFLKLNEPSSIDDGYQI
jgi:hypothetical protein